MKTLSRKRITEILTETAVRYYAKKGYSVYPEVGIQSGGNLRADVLAMNMKGKISIIEVKSCWQDFATDTKWKSYLPFCNQFYFCIPKYLYVSEKGQFIKNVCKENKVGLFVVGNGNSEYHEIAKDKDKFTTQQNVWMYSVSGCKQTNIAGKDRRWLITKLAWRGGISKAVLGGRVRDSLTVTEEYDFTVPITETQFLYVLDDLDRKRYLKAFPKSSFKKLMKDPEIHLKLDSIKRNKL